jgi:hypothetical protein
VVLELPEERVRFFFVLRGKWLHKKKKQKLFLYKLFTTGEVVLKLPEEVFVFFCAD